MSKNFAKHTAAWTSGLAVVVALCVPALGAVAQSDAAAGLEQLHGGWTLNRELSTTPPEGGGGRGDAPPGGGGGGRGFGGPGGMAAFLEAGAAEGASADPAVPVLAAIPRKCEKPWKPCVRC